MTLKQVRRDECVFLKEGLRDENVCPSEAQTRQLKEVELVWMSLNGPDDEESETSIAHFFRCYIDRRVTSCLFGCWITAMEDWN